jgi:hypothetical protein
MKHRAAAYVVTAVGAVLAAVLIGDGYLRTRRASAHAVTLKTAVAAMSIQELARRVGECEPSPGSGAPVKHDAAYCAEVMRAIEQRPLQLVEPSKSTPASQTAGSN